MERIKLDYEPLRAAVARGDRAHIEAEARKLRDRHIADLVVRAATGIWSVVTAKGRGMLASYKHWQHGAPHHLIRTPRLCERDILQPRKLRPRIS